MAIRDTSLDHVDYPEPGVPGLPVTDKERMQREARRRAVAGLPPLGPEDFMPLVAEGSESDIAKARRGAWELYVTHGEDWRVKKGRAPARVSTTDSMLDATIKCAECREVVAITFMDPMGRRVCGACSGQDEVAWAASRFEAEVTP